MALEILLPVAELIANIAFVLRYGKSRIPVEPVSVPTACLAFLMFGVVIAVISASVISSFSHQTALLTFTGLMTVCTLVGWRMRNSLGFLFSSLYALAYVLSFSVGVASVLLVAF